MNRMVLKFCNPAVNMMSRCFSTETTRIKHKVPQKRASKLIGILRNEEYEKLRAGRNFPEIRAGDSISIEKLPFITSQESHIVKGVVISVTNRLSDSALQILNVENGTPVKRRIVLYSPLIKEIKVLQRAFIHNGKKRVRRGKLYYLMERDPATFTVK